MRIGSDHPQAERKDTDDERAEQHAKDRAAATEERDATDHHGGNRLDVGELAGGRRDRADAADQYPAGEGADQAGADIDRNQRPFDLNAGEFRRVRVVANGIDVAAQAVCLRM